MEKIAQNQKPIFIVSSGRTGSTILANMLNRHPQILIISDLFEPAGPIPYFDIKKKISGREFFKMLSQQTVKPRIRYWQEQATKERLFYPDDVELVSLLLCYTIPFISNKPMELFEEIKYTVIKFKPATPANHLLRFFDYLRDRYDKDIWVERTGGSLPHLPKIYSAYPDAKIIHNYRDGRETAISMQSYPFFRMYLQMLQNPDLDEWDFDYRPPLNQFGRMWEDWVLQAENTMDKIPDDQKHYISFENFLNKPYDSLKKLTLFIFDKDTLSMKEKEWVKTEAAKIKKPPIRFDKLEKEEQTRLEESCSEGLKRLGYNLKVTQPKIKNV